MRVYEGLYSVLIFRRNISRYLFFFFSYLFYGKPGAQWPLIDGDGDANKQKFAPRRGCSRHQSSVLSCVCP